MERIHCFMKHPLPDFDNLDIASAISFWKSRLNMISFITQFTTCKDLCSSLWTRTRCTPWCSKWIQTLLQDVGGFRRCISVFCNFYFVLPSYYKNLHGSKGLTNPDKSGAAVAISWSVKLLYQPLWAMWTRRCVRPALASWRNLIQGITKIRVFL